MLKKIVDLMADVIVLMSATAFFAVLAAAPLGYLVGGQLQSWPAVTIFVADTVLIGFEVAVKLLRAM